MTIENQTGVAYGNLPTYTFAMPGVVVVNTPAPQPVIIPAQVQQPSIPAKAEESKTMSIFSKIASAEHTFAAWAEKELAKLYSVAPTIEQMASTVLTYAGPALQTIVTADLGAAAGAVVGKVIQQAQSDLVAASSLIYDFGPSPSVSSILTAVKNNLAALLTAGHVTSATSVATVTKVTNELSTLATAITPAAATTTTA